MATIQDYDDSIVIELYKQLTKLFGQGSQAFCMEYPPRNLNARDYAYTIEDNTGVLTKPQQVAEAEFNLSDNMIELAPMVQGSTGERVSNLFKSVLNNYIPRLHYAARLAEEKGKLKRWLLQPIEGQVLDYDEEAKNFVSVAFKGTRMEYSARLYRTYLYKRQDFNELVNRKKEAASRGRMSNSNESVSAREGLTEFADWLSTVAATKEEILSTFYNDAVVRGNLHEVNSAISFLDIPSLGQRINEIKRDLRSNVKRSVIGGGNVYTVNFSPSNWFESLIKAPSPIDVVSNTSYREHQIELKKGELTNAKHQLSLLQTLHVSKDQHDKLGEEIKGLTKEIDAVYVEVRSKFQDRLVSAVRFAQDALTKTARFAAAASTGGIGAALLSEVTQVAEKQARADTEGEKGKISEIVQQTKETLTSFVKLDRARQQSIDLQSKLALAKSSDYESQVTMLQHQINKLTEELRVLESEDKMLASSSEQIERAIKHSALSTEDSSIQEGVRKLENPEEAEAEERDKAIETAKEALKSMEHGSSTTDQLVFQESVVKGLDKDGIKNLPLPGEFSGDAGAKKELDDIKSKFEQNKDEPSALNEAKKELKELKGKKTTKGKNVYTDAAVNVLKTQDQIKTLEVPANFQDNDSVKNKLKNIKEKLEKSLQSIVTNREKKKNAKLVSLAKRMGLGKEDDEVDDYYQTIIVEIEESSVKSRSERESEASNGGGSYDYWICSGSHSSSSSSSSTSAESTNENLKIKVKLRATKVNIERGGWFGVDILRMTEGMFHVDPNLKSATGNEGEDFRKNGNIKSVGKFAHYPMSFIIVKDVEITKSSTKEFKSDSQKSSSSSDSSRSDSWLSSSHNESSHQSRYSEKKDDTTTYFETISLPNPAILGWFQQIVPKDESIEYGSDANGASEAEFSEVVNKFLKSVVFDNSPTLIEQ